MSEKVQDLYDEDEFQSLLDDAEANASNDFECKFVSDMQDRWEQYGKRMYLSDKQKEILERIANDE